jgi:high affinity Mn2+ porin
MAQFPPDTLGSARWNLHFQQTVVPQYHPYFQASYSDTFSLQQKAESEVSLTTTFFAGLRLWKNSEVYFNPELAGGSGLSQARGVAGFTNGETFRIGNPKPQIYLARLYLQQLFPLSHHQERRDDAANQLPGKKATEYISISLGKFSIADFFDQNKYSHDPRSQFLNWSLMSNGAWDYPANTRGYTVGCIIEYIRPSLEIRYGAVMVPKQANGNKLDNTIRESHSQSLELSRFFRINDKKGAIRLLVFYTNASMGNYKSAIDEIQLSQRPDISLTRAPGRNKYGFGLNMQQDLTINTGIFLRASWNDGKNETWAFTEIDRAMSAGIVTRGNAWNRKEDVCGFAIAANGISRDHQRYLQAGGHGFMIGDGNLNYGPEIITELYYNFCLHEQHFWVSPDYQFIIHPAYNKDRGPVHVIAMRFHVAF